MRQFCAEFACARPALSSRTMDVLRDYAWPGNVRELSNLVRRFVRTSAGRMRMSVRR